MVLNCVSEVVGSMVMFACCVFGMLLLPWVVVISVGMNECFGVVGRCGVPREV
jgi:hypothetical protein